MRERAVSSSLQLSLGHAHPLLFGSFSSRNDQQTPMDFGLTLYAYGSRHGDSRHACELVPVRSHIVNAGHGKCLSPYQEVSAVLPTVPQFQVQGPEVQCTSPNQQNHEDMLHQVAKNNIEVQLRALDGLYCTLIERVESLVEQSCGSDTSAGLA